MYVVVYYISISYKLPNHRLPLPRTKDSWSLEIEIAEHYEYGICNITVNSLSDSTLFYQTYKSVKQQQDIAVDHLEVQFVSNSR